MPIDRAPLPRLSATADTGIAAWAALLRTHAAVLPVLSRSRVSRVVDEFATAGFVAQEPPGSPTRKMAAPPSLP